MLLADTHTHLYLSEFDSDRSEVVMRSIDSGVEMMFLPNIDYVSLSPMLSLCESYSNNCFPMVGLHPTSVKENYAGELEKIYQKANNHKFVAVGEIGLDLYWDDTFYHEQLEALKWQINFALDNDLPVIIHTRNTMEPLLEMLQGYKQRFKGILHAFSGDPRDARRAVEMGFLLGIGGPVTYKKSTQPEVVREVGVDKIVLETDSPYLSPVPYRGKRNESSYICTINEKVATILNLSPEEVAETTFRNSRLLFGV